MKSFTCQVSDELGIHARPAGLLAKEARQYNSRIILKANTRTAEAVQVMAVLGMEIKCGDTLEIEITGDDEEAALEGIKGFFQSGI